MKKFLIGAVQIGLILLLLVVAFVFSRAPSIDDIESELGEPTSNTESSLYVSVVRPEVNSTNLFVETTGTVEARNSVAMATQVAGRVVWISEDLRNGGAFDAGQELLRIDPIEFELGVAQAEANLEVAKANLELRLAESQAAKENWEIMHGGADVPELVAKLPQISQSRANISTAKASLETAKLQLSRTSFSLPFNGKVLTTDAGVGQFLGKGQVFGLTYDANSLEVRVDISASEIQLLNPAKGRGAGVLMGGTRFDAIVERTSSSVDRRSRTTTLYLTFQSPNDLLPGHFVDVQIAGREATESYRLPATAEQAQSSLWIIRDDKLERYDPEIIARTGGEIVVSAFDYGEGIVVGTLNNVHSGMHVVATNL